MEYKPEVVQVYVDWRCTGIFREPLYWIFKSTLALWWLRVNCNLPGNTYLCIEAQAGWKRLCEAANVCIWPNLYRLKSYFQIHSSLQLNAGSSVMATSRQLWNLLLSILSGWISMQHFVIIRPPSAVSLAEDARVHYVILKKWNQLNRLYHVRDSSL